MCYIRYVDLKINNSSWWSWKYASSFRLFLVEQLMTEPKSFGAWLRFFRNRCTDPNSGKYLTQTRLTELLELESNVPYSYGTISNWERGKSSIHHKERHVLVSLIKILYQYGGLHSLLEAQTFLRAGGYRVLNETEITHINQGWFDEGVSSPTEEKKTEADRGKRPLWQQKQVTALLIDFYRVERPLQTTEINRVWADLHEVAAKYGGVTHKVVRDVVLFGVPEADEYHPPHAVEAALDMQQAIIDLSKRTRYTLQLQILVHTDQMLWQAEHPHRWKKEDVLRQLIGLQAEVEDGGVFITPATYRHVHDHFITVKRTLGYIVQGYRSRSPLPAPGGVAGIQPSMVGRAYPMERLQQAWQTSQKKQKLQVVTIIGEAGIGKSRLLYEFNEWLKSHISANHIWQLTVGERSGQVPYVLLRQLLLTQLQIEDKDSVEIAQAKLEEGLTAHFGPSDTDIDRKIDLIGRLIGLVESLGQEAIDERQRLQAFYYLVDYFIHAIEMGLRVLLIDDCHWADDDSLAFLEYLMWAERKPPLLIVCTARPLLQERRSDWGQAPCHHAYNLEPLDEWQREDLVQEILSQVPHIPPELSHFIAERSEGNPFYMQELVSWLIEEGVIVRGEVSWQIRLALDKDQVPATLFKVLQARHDRLPLSMRQVLQKAAVVGRTFWLEAVSHLQEAENIEQLGRVLSHLEQRGLIARSHAPQKVLEGTAYIFNHDLFHDVVYQKIPNQPRQTYHAQVANWLTQYNKKRANEQAALIGAHLLRAKKLKKAWPWFVTSGQQAQQVFANGKAIQDFERALSLMAEIRPLPLIEKQQCLIALGELYMTIGQYDTSRNYWTEAYQLAKDLNAEEYQIVSCLGLSRLYERSGQEANAYNLALQWAEQGLTIVGKAETEAKIKLLFNQVIIYYRQANYQTALSMCKRCLELATHLDNHRMEAQAYRWLGIITNAVGKRQEALAYCNKALTLFEDEQQIAAGQLELANIYFDMGRWQKAENIWQQTNAIYRRMGDIYHTIFVKNNLGEIALNQGRTLEALEIYADCLTTAEEIGASLWLQGTFHNNLGATYIQLGNIEAALSHLRISKDFFTQIQSAEHLPELYRLFAKAYLADGHLDEANRYAQQSLNLAQDLHVADEVAHTLHVLGALSRQQGDIKKAQIQWQQSLTLLKGEIQDLYGTAEVSLSLAQLYSQQGKREAALSLAQAALTTFETLMIQPSITKSKQLINQLLQK